ncbi:DMT family transporter [Alicyclobacillus acidocaldarius]|uniref:Small multidrug resistance protein n=1 Tax=Alicyclobacillus acidocaldarius subsp. acidocaldarius (strain ATCC 27009 / DSM 446 / BCRC 14685 / JCM 5260 / KCTC 1825 / NBRC 15652 / NCIMB 11725 / NRRL B-14509 / 104-IA) TaxID=521098 RepID=C8WXS5_ALIAD|nr:multidrug efflux SMR transporter [Alicyclobacillus acidocaldarius]ACV58896.1 small multidrug resistance protein [Alicyclobacillus acidocaldarius subsp. acidocaldarius DSM 446]
MNAWFLAAAIACEVFATSMLKLTHGFSRLWPSLAVVLGYALSFYALSQALRTIPIGVAYAIWSGVGTAAIAAIGAMAYRQPVTPMMVVGIGLIVAGVVILNLHRPLH